MVISKKGVEGSKGKEEWVQRAKSRGYGGKYEIGHWVETETGSRSWCVGDVRLWAGIHAHCSMGGLLPHN